MSIRHWVATALLAVASISGFTSRIPAQQAASPVATVVLAPLDRTIKDLTWFMSAINVGEMAPLFELMADSYTTGLDKSRPLGVLLSLEDNMPVPLVCLPVSDHKQFFAALGNAGIQPDELGNDLYEIAAGPQIVIAKVANGWLYVGQNEDAVSNIPQNPAELFGDYSKRYNVTIKLDVQQIPAELKEMAIENMRAGFENAMAEQGGDAEQQREYAEAQFAQFKEMINSTQQILVGWLIDASKQQVHLDGAVQYVSGSKLASQIESLAKLSSEFTGLVLPGASGEFRVTSMIADPADKTAAKQALKNALPQLEKGLDDSNLPEQIRDLVKKFASSMIGIAEKTIEEGIADGSASVSVTDDKLRILLGTRIADGRAVEKELKELVAGLPKDDKVTVQFDSGKHKGFNLHRVAVRVPDGNEEARMAFGENLQIFIAVSDKAIVACLDPSSDSAMKAAIDAMGARKGVEVSPANGILRISSLLRFANHLSPNPALESAINVISKFSNKDTVQFNTTVLPRGIVSRISVDEGVLNAIGTAVKQGAGGRNPGF